MPDISCLILARGQSKGIPRKNIRLLNQKPLIFYVLSEAKKLPYKVYVSTEDKEIASIAWYYGAEIIARPPELAQDASKSIEAVQDALKTIKADIIVLLNACTPFVRSEDIEGAINMMLETKADSVCSLVEDFSCHPSKITLFEDDGNNEIVRPKNDWWETSERQKLDRSFKRNTAIYIAKREVIESGTFFGKNLYGYVMPKERSYDLNDEHDWLVAELLMQHLNK